MVTRTLPFALALALALALATAPASATPVPPQLPNTAATVSAATLTPLQLLAGVLELIKETSSLNDISPSTLTGLFQHPVTTFAPGNFGYSGTLTPEWTYVLEVQYAGTDRARLDLTFSDTTAKRSAAATAICTMDFDHFASDLREAGFTRETTYGEHGNVIFDRITGRSLSLVVVTRADALPPPGKPIRSCIQAVVVT